MHLQTMASHIYTKLLRSEMRPDATGSVDPLSVDTHLLKMIV